MTIGGMTATTRRPRRPSRLPVVLYAHPFELAVGVAITIIGLRSLVEGTTTPSVDALPAVPLFLYRSVSVIGGVGMIAGLVWRQHATARLVERAALYGVGSTWVAYCALVVWFQGWEAGFSTGLLAALIGAACILRALAIRKTERVILATLRAAAAAPDPEVLRRLVDSRASDDKETGRE